MKSLAFKSVLLKSAAVWVACLLLVLLDLTISYVAPRLSRLDYMSPALIYNHPLYGYQSSPNSEGWYERPDFRNYLNLNQYGRHDDAVREKERPRIVTVGGSFTAGHEVATEQTWPKVFSRDFPRDMFEVVNMAHQGKKFNYFSRYLDRRFFSELKPDYLIFGFYYDRMSPDVAYAAAEMSCQRIGKRKGFLYVFGSKGSGPATQIVDELAALFPMGLYESFPQFRRSSIMNIVTRYRQDRFKARHPEYRKMYINGNLVYDVNCDKPASDANTRQHIQTILKAGREHGVPILFFFIPGKPCYLEGRDAAGTIPRYFSKEDYVVDLCEDFKQDYAKRKVLLHWKDDGHPNAEGYKLIGHAVSRHFKRWWQGQTKNGSKKTSLSVSR